MIGWLILLLGVTPAAYGSSHDRDRMGAAAASLYHSLSNAGPGDPSHACDLHHSSWQRRILNPLNEARDRTHVLRTAEPQQELPDRFDLKLEYNKPNRER